MSLALRAGGLSELAITDLQKDLNPCDQSPFAEGLAHLSTRNVQREQHRKT